MSPLPAPAAQHSSNLPIREDWLAQWREEMLEPDLPIVDPHHHLWDRPGWRYLLEEFLADVNSGHNVLASVFVQCRSMYRREGPEELRPLGETEFVNGVAAMSASGGSGAARICAGIVGHADLRLGARVENVLEAHVRAGGGRFRGIRHISAWDADASIMNPSYRPPPGLLADRGFREGFARLAPLGLSFDAWLYHPQVDELAALAQEFPDTPIVLDHVGGPLGIALGRLHPRARPLRERQREARRARDADRRLCFSPASAAALVRSLGERLAAVFRDLHRRLRHRPLHVREQFSGRQGLLWLRGVLECLQDFDPSGRRGRKGGSVQPHRGAVLPARPAVLSVQRMSSLGTFFADRLDSASR